MKGFYGSDTVIPLIYVGLLVSVVDCCLGLSSDFCIIYYLDELLAVYVHKQCIPWALVIPFMIVTSSVLSILYPPL
jgi:hypothetical protein